MCAISFTPIDEVDQIATMIEEEFFIDEDNSVDKRKIDNDKFGYRSLHYVANLKRDRINLPEYSSYGEQKFEFKLGQSYSTHGLRLSMI